MRRLLWKEWHERRLWLALWAAATVVTAALGIGQSGLGAMPEAWFQLPLALAVIAGLGGYGSELKGERATFLYSRNISWKAVLAAKLLPGLATAVLAPALGALAILVFSPPEYHHLLTPGALASGALTVAGFSGAGFLVGLGCSIILHGLAGSMLALFIGIAAVSVYGFLLYEVLGISSAEISVMPAFLAAPFIALAIIARFGIALSGAARLRRFLLVLLGLFLLCLVIDLSPPFRAYARSLVHDDTYTNTSLSPTGHYALVTKTRNEKSSRYFLDLRNGKRYPAPAAIFPNNGATSWLNDDYLSIQRDKNREPSMLTVVRFTANGPRTLTFSGLDFYGTRYLLSPDAKRLLLAKWDDLTVCDLETGAQRTLLRLPRPPRRLPRAKAKPTPYLEDYWWQANNVVGYLDPVTKKRILVRVSEP